MNRLKEVRLNAGLSQKQVAKTIGVAAPTVSQWESGIANPTNKNLVKLAQLYGVSTDYLLSQETKKEPAPRINPKAQVLIEKLSTMTPEEIQTLERTVDFVLALRANK